LKKSFFDMTHAGERPRVDIGEPMTAMAAD
jgi:hypothetical protein